MVIKYVVFFMFLGLVLSYALVMRHALHNAIDELDEWKTPLDPIIIDEAEDMEEEDNNG